MLNPKAHTIDVEGISYSVVWADYGDHLKLSIYKDGKRIGFRDLPILVSQEPETIRYFIKRMVRCGIVKRLPKSKRETESDLGY